MTISYDGRVNPEGLITFTGIPNILRIDAGTTQGSAAELRITIDNLSQVDLTKEYYIIINNQTIKSSSNPTSVMEFYITQNNGDTNKKSVAASIVKALRNVNLPDYEIFQLANNGQLTATVVIRAREVGDQYAINFSSTLGSIISTQSYEGSSTDGLIGNVIGVDVYSNGDYITSLSKTYYKQKIDFNLSQILTSISRYDFLTPYELVISATSNNGQRSIGYLSGMNSAIGYSCNQGAKVFTTTGTYLAQNVGRGTQSGVYNKTVLYTFNSSIPLSLYTDSLINPSIEIRYLDAAKDLLHSKVEQITVSGGYAYGELNVFDDTYWDQAYYIDLVISGVGTVRYNIIKPLDATSRCQRIYWHNSYGGVSFFDFTGKISEEHKTSKTTYTKNIFDYYADTSMEQAKVYGNDTSITVTMESHLMERSAVWLFNDLLSAYDVWTTINGVDYKIIVQSVKCDEQETGVWKATITYTYSLI